MTTDNRALWELVRESAYQLEEAALAARAPEMRSMMDIAGKLREILERPVVVGDCPAPFAWVYRYRAGDYSTRIFFIHPDQDEIDSHRNAGGDIVPLYLPSEKTS